MVRAWGVSIRRAGGPTRIDPTTYHYRSRRPGRPHSKRGSKRSAPRGHRSGGDQCCLHDRGPSKSRCSDPASPRYFQRRACRRDEFGSVAKGLSIDAHHRSGLIGNRFWKPIWPLAYSTTDQVMLDLGRPLGGSESVRCRRSSDRWVDRPLGSQSTRDFSSSSECVRSWPSPSCTCSRPLWVRERTRFRGRALRAGRAWGEGSANQLSGTTITGQASRLEDRGVSSLQPQDRSPR